MTTNAGEGGKEAVAYGRNVASLIMLSFGFVWLGWGFSTLEAFSYWKWILLYVVFLAALVPTVSAIRQSRARMKSVGEDRENLWSKNRSKFRIVTALEGAGCGIVVFLCVFFQRLDLLAVGISLVVAIHFIPLGALFHYPTYYVTSIAIMICDVLSVLFFRADAITTVAGIGTGLILWITAAQAFYVSNFWLGANAEIIE